MKYYRHQHTAKSGGHPKPAEEAATPSNSLNPMKVDGILIPSRDSDGYYSATTIANVTGKDFGDYLLDPQGTDLLDCLADDEGSGCKDLICTDLNSTGTPGATWVHSTLAVQFAAWSSPGFALMYSRLIVSMLQASAAANSMPPVPDDVKELVDILSAGIASGTRNRASQN